MNSLDAGLRVFGFGAVLVALGVLVAYGAWGALAFIAAGVPVVRWAERRR